MGLSLETRPFDTAADRIHRQVPEFSLHPPSDVLMVDEGEIATGTIVNRFRSEGFECCSGIAIENPYGTLFGFFHAHPGQELTDEMTESLKPLADGHACVIRGTGSTSKTRLMRELWGTLGITHTDTIPVDTYMFSGKRKPFHIAYRPAANQILVARISHKDILRFTSFRR
jgi:hypothetical protein